MTAVIYARYSSDNQREESIEGQIRECTAYAEKNGITVVKHYIDRALSAKTDNRPDFQQMIKDSEKRLFDIVLVWKLDRFARNRYDSAHYEYQLERNHVKLVSATEPISDSPAGIMVKSMLTGMAEYYSAELSEKVVRGMTENVLKGKYNGGTIPIGFKVDEEKFFQIDPLKAPFVVEAFQRYNDGATMKELMNWLNDSGVTTNRNQKFTYNSVQKLLTNKRYIGENRFKDIVMPDSIPAIVDKDLFEEVQLKIKKNSRAPARHKAEDDYLLTTKLFCGMCGAMMFGECGTGRNKVVHHYYKCNHHSVVICPLTHNGAALQRRINISADGVPCLAAEFTIHQAVKIILLRRSFQEECVSRLKAGTRSGFRISQIFFLQFWEHLCLQYCYFAFVVHKKLLRFQCV